MTVIIMSGDYNWEQQFTAAFKRRVSFELRDTQTPKFSKAELYKVLSEWSVRWGYSPKFLSLNNVYFCPLELLATGGEHPQLTPPVRLK